MSQLVYVARALRTLAHVGDSGTQVELIVYPTTSLITEVSSAMPGHYGLKSPTSDRELGQWEGWYGGVKVTVCVRSPSITGDWRPSVIGNGDSAPPKSQRMASVGALKHATKLLSSSRDSFTYGNYNSMTKLSELDRKQVVYNWVGVGEHSKEVHEADTYANQYAHSPNCNARYHSWRTGNFSCVYLPSIP